MRDPLGRPIFLVPTTETLELLKTVDFSSFTDSGCEASLVADSDSDDPFDSDDLLGILDERVIKHPLGLFLPSEDVLAQSSPVKHAPPVKSETRVKCESPTRVSERSVEPQPASDPSGPKLASLDAPEPKAAALDISAKVSPRKIQASSSYLMSPRKLSPVKLSQPSILGSPQMPLKRIKMDPPLQPRQFSTTATSRAKSDLTATIQLSTQRPDMGAARNGKFGISEPGIIDSERKVVRPIILSKEQEYVLRLAKLGKSLFFTGSAGTGKSVLLRSIIKALKDKHGPGTVAVTASTGLAACNIGGITVHSFAGIGLGKGEVSDLIKNIKRNRKAMQRWKATKVLIVDEISMIDGRLFDKLDAIAREIRRKKSSPFGGIQLVVCGDFYQLPPVSKMEMHPDGSETKEEALFAFESTAWRQNIASSIILKEVFRQKGDQVFIDMLNDMRNGIVSTQAEQEFMRLSRPLLCPAGIEPTELYSTRFEVDHANNVKLAKLDGSARVYTAKDGGTLPPQVRASVLANFLAPQKLFLKERAQVMCIKNFDDTLVNGSLGQVIGFVNRDTYMCTNVVENNPNLSFEEVKKLLAKEKVKYELSQQGATPDQVDEATIEALSQKVKAPVNLLDSVFNFFHEDESPPVENVDQMTTEQLIEMNKKRKLEFIEQLLREAQGEKYPLVRFLNPDGVTTRDVLVEPEKWDIEDEKTKEILVSRVQLPLMLAWALSIHKSQGQTLQKVKVDLTRIFENGQAYVALSRAVARDGLQIVNFRKDKVRTHRAVEDFYLTLSTTEDLAKTTE